MGAVAKVPLTEYHLYLYLIVLHSTDSTYLKTTSTPPAGEFNKKISNLRWQPLISNNSEGVQYGVHTLLLLTILYGV